MDPIEFIEKKHIIHCISAFDSYLGCIMKTTEAYFVPANNSVCLDAKQLKAIGDKLGEIK